MREVKPNTKWRHFKGSIAEVIAVAKHTETGEELVIYKCTNNNELLNIEVRFDYNFKHINGTIFQTKNGGCELGESVALWLDDYSSPIVDQLDLCYKK